MLLSERWYNYHFQLQKNLKLGVYHGCCVVPELCVEPAARFVFHSARQVFNTPSLQHVVQHMEEVEHAVTLQGGCFFLTNLQIPPDVSVLISSGGLNR